MGRIVKYDTDCADCLCRVCARNQHIDSDVEYEGLIPNCDPCMYCTIGETELVDIPEECPSNSYLTTEIGGESMSMYGESQYNSEKNYIYREIEDFLGSHPVSELLEILSDVLRDKNT